MKVRSLNQINIKIKTKGELIDLLKKYKGILSPSIISYLNSLIELEFSAVKEISCDTDREALNELEIYKQIFTYNIYNRIQNLFKQQNPDFIVPSYSGKFNGISVTTNLEDRKIQLLDIDYIGNNIGKNNTSTMTCNYISEISLFQSIENIHREAELKKLTQALEALYGEQSLYRFSPNTFRWSNNEAFDHSNEIKRYEENIKKLNSKTVLSDIDKKEIEITSKIHQLLLEEFGLNNESFTEEKEKLFFGFENEKNEFEKVLIKRMPNLTISDHIKYI